MALLDRLDVAFIYEKGCFFNPVFIINLFNHNNDIVWSGSNILEVSAKYEICEGGKW